MSAALVLAFAAAGAWVATFEHQQFLQAPLLESAARFGSDPSRRMAVRGWVAGDPIRRRDRLRFLFQVEEAAGLEGWQACEGIVRVSLREAEGAVRVRYGQRLEMPLRLRQARNFRNPGAFDYRRSLEGEGIHLLGNLKSWKLVRVLPGRAGTRILLPVHRLRTLLIDRLERALPGSEGEEARRFLGAILLGERDGGEGKLDPLLRKTGVYHILSISGLHFALLLTFVARVARSLPGGPRMEGLLLLLVGGLYLLLAGAEDPILRSALAALSQRLGRWTGRRVSSWNAQALAALAVLSARPLHLFHPGFQLSFLATLGILASGIPWWRRLRTIPLVGKPLVVSLGAWIASTPVMAATFFQVSPVALVMNLLAGPFLSLSLAWGALLLIFPLDPLGASLKLCLYLFGRACTLALMLPGAFLHVPPPRVLLLGGLAALVLARLQLGMAAGQTERRILGGGILAALALIAFPVALWLPEDSLTITALDVGQGDSLLLGLPGGHWILVDGGGFSATEFDVGERVVYPALMAMGVRRLDLVVLTHGHQDHGGGLAAVLEALPPSEIWSGRSPADSPLIRRIEDFARVQGIPLLHPTRGSVKCFGGSCLEVIHPPRGYREGAPVSNDDSLVFRLAYRRTSVLLTGDVESEGESLILESGLGLSAQVLKVPHHGSASSTSPRLLAKVSPRMAIVSVGEGNPWGHPAEKVLERLRGQGVSVFRTDRDGAVQLISDGWRWKRSILAP